MRAFASLAGVVTAGMLMVAAPGSAAAGGFGVAIGGSVSGSVSGAVVVGGYAGGGAVAVYDDGFAEPPPPIPYQPPPPPCECCGCQPVYYSPPPTYYAPPPAQVVVVKQRRPERSLEFGLGLSASSTNLRGEGGGPTQELEGGALLLRLRGEAVELERELGHDESVDGYREEDRVGGAILLHVLRTGGLSAYGLLGAGVIDSATPYDAERRFGYGALGMGLALRLGRFTIGGDLRWQARKHLRGDDDVRVAGPAGEQASAIYVPERERGVEARVLGVFYF